MARLIVFSDYLGPKEKVHQLVSMNYIATRDGVQMNGTKKMNDSLGKYDESTKIKTQTYKQEKLINEMITTQSDLAYLKEYESYQEDKSMFHASSFLTAALERLEEMTFSNKDYLKYISERPGVQLNIDDTHGLFSQIGAVDYAEYYKEIEQHSSYVWRDIISLRREDAVELAFDQQGTWMQLLQDKMRVKAEVLGIPTEHFRWCAAFHDEGYHPHVHVMCWDQTGKAGHLDKEGISTFKSKLANDIFSDELWMSKELKNETRFELEDTYKKYLDDITKNVSKSFHKMSNSILEKELKELSSMVKGSGKEIYAYQSKDTKDKVNTIVSYLLNRPEMKPLLKEYLLSQQRIVSFYKEDINDYMNSFVEKLISPGDMDKKVLHNAIIKSAYELKHIKEMTSAMQQNAFGSLNEKIASNDFKHESIDHKKTGLAVARIGLLQEKSKTDILMELSLIIPDEEERLETLLYAKEHPRLGKTDLNMVNKMYEEAIDYSKDVEQISKITNSSIGNVVQRTISNFLSSMAQGTKEHMRELKRMKSVRNEDRYLIRKANRKK